MKILLTLSLLFCCSSVFAWGERGHDLVTRVAAKKLEEISGFGKELSRPFTLRDHMLSHLSNVPDFHWRADYMSRSDRDLNDYTHFIGLESVYPNARHVEDIDLQLSDFIQRAKAKGFKEPARIGTAPWRVLQLHRSMTQALRNAKTAKSRKQKIRATNQALLYGGLLSHFVADLANPHHTSTNYDGQLTGNTGLHAYFESDVVRELPFSLAADVAQATSLQHLQKTVLSTFNTERRQAVLNDPRQLIFALTLDSHRNRDRLLALDDRHSIIERSADVETDAVRIAPERAMSKYRPFIVERLAAGAAVVTQLWVLAWLEADQPDLSDFHSFHYWIMPDFIVPDYLP